ncbi:hypothetical protein R6258_04035 [Halomonas sp. HP20-15]|uniref:hypothetical protein n=1 Tax=Halomonas sp. HP20-15 TaxID=3085901 RepID=UPI002982A1B4|nr:hypothetical protein [Halomonas sp. HP20-15]MDW5376082.1 hypothetical protein [Halomonas sp. HP20-15]
MHRQDADNARPPLLDLLIVVTLTTVVVALGYLLHYDLSRAGDGTRAAASETTCRVARSVVQAAPDAGTKNPARQACGGERHSHG